MVSKRSSAQRVLRIRTQVGRWVTTALIGVAVLTGPTLISPRAQAAQVTVSEVR